MYWETKQCAPVQNWQHTGGRSRSSLQRGSLEALLGHTEMVLEKLKLSAN